MNARALRLPVVLVLSLAALTLVAALSRPRPVSGESSPSSSPSADRALCEALLAEFEAEATTTARVLDRVPADRLDWKPHPTSRSLGTLAQHVATLPGLVVGFLAEDRLDFATVDRTEPEPESKAAVLAQHAASREAVVRYLQQADDRQLARPWTLANGDQEGLTLPRAAVLRSFMLSHQIHHRGQLTVYLRMLEVPVPSVYGPSRDEMPAFLAVHPAPGD